MTVRSADKTISAWRYYSHAVSLLIIGAGLLLPFGVDRFARDALGISPFDQPWLAVNLTLVVVVVSFLAAGLGVVAKWRPAINGSTAARIGLAAVAITFGVAPILKMATGWSSYVLMGGLLPISDAQGYFAGALDFLDSGRLGAWVTRRPLVATHLAGVFELTNLDLRLAVLSLAAGCALAALLILSSISRAFGWTVACVAALCLFCFIYPTLGTTMSESLGFSAGCAAFVLLWEGALRTRAAFVMAGMAILGFALAARAGALFILPALVVWTGLYFAKAGRFHWLYACGALVAASLGFVATQLLVATIGAPGQMAYSNFSTVIYGLVDRGAGWTQVFADHPELVPIPEGEQAMRIYRLALEHALAAPLDPIVGIIRRYAQFLIGWHQYVPGTRYLRWALTLLTFIGIAHCIRNRAKPIESLLLVGAVGILLSVPFTGDGGTRVFAATHPFTVGLVAIGIVAVRQGLSHGHLWRGRENSACSSAAPLAMFLALVLLLPIPIALAVATGRSAPPGEEPRCEGNQVALRGIAPRHGTISICPAGISPCSHGVKAESVQATNTARLPQVSQLGDFSAPVRISIIASPSGSSVNLLIRDGLPNPEGSFAACGQVHDQLFEVISVPKP